MIVNTSHQKSTMRDSLSNTGAEILILMLLFLTSCFTGCSEY